MTGTPRARQPEFADLWNLLEQRGIHAEVAVLEYEGFQSWADMDEFYEEYRPPLAEAWDQAKAEAWVADNVTQDPDGRFVYGRGRSFSGVAHWQPRR